MVPRTFVGIDDGEIYTQRSSWFVSWFVFLLGGEEKNNCFNLHIRAPVAPTAHRVIGVRMAPMVIIALKSQNLKITEYCITIGKDVDTELLSKLTVIYFENNRIRIPQI